MRRALITAHSGCDNTSDNSIEFLDYAVGLPVDCIEVDVRRQAGGELVITHDEAQHEVPALWQAFERLNSVPNMKINCDLKEPNLEIVVLELAKYYGIQNRLIYSGGKTNLNLLEHCSELTQIVDVFLNIEMLVPLLDSDWQKEGIDISDIVGDMIHAAKKALSYNATCLNLHYEWCIPQFAYALNEMGLPFSVWTPNDPRDIETFCKMGAYNITTRNPNTALKIRDSIYPARL